jgi:hypothetical protein
MWARRRDYWKGGLPRIGELSNPHLRGGRGTAERGDYIEDKRRVLFGNAKLPYWDGFVGLGVMMQNYKVGDLGVCSMPRGVG